MALDKRVYEFINSRIRTCEDFYGIDVLCWYCRGSLGFGRHRKNSDFDIGFIFKARKDNPNPPHAIHDIIGWGYDAWGWSIEEATDCILANQRRLCDGIDDINVIYPTREHARTEFTYFNDIYMYVDNPIADGTEQFKNQIVPILKDICEIPLIANHTMFEVKKMIGKMRLTDSATLYDYLIAIWHIYICKGFVDGSYMSVVDTIELAEKYSNDNIVSVLKQVQDKYYNSLTKRAQIVRIPELSDYIRSEYDELIKYCIGQQPRNSYEYVKEQVDKILWEL